MVCVDLRAYVCQWASILIKCSKQGCFPDSELFACVKGYFYRRTEVEEKQSQDFLDGDCGWIRLNKQAVVISLNFDLMLRSEQSPRRMLSIWLETLDLIFKPNLWAQDRKTTLEVDDIFSAVGMRLFQQRYFQEILRGWIILSVTEKREFGKLKTGC